jgi:hypothetical protein
MADRLLCLLAETRKRANPAGFCSGGQLVEAVDLEPVVQCFDPLRPQPRQVQQLDQLGRRAPRDLVKQGRAAGLDDLPDLVREIASNAGQRFEVLALGDHRGEALG